MAKAFNSLVERFLVFVISVSFFLALSILIEPILNKPDMGKIFINWFFYILLGLSGLLILLIQEIFVREKIKTYLHIVACFFYDLLMVLICGLTGQMNLPYIILPALTLLYIVEYFLNNMFVFHDNFINEFGSLKGKELEAHLFHNNLSAIDFGEKAKHSQGFLSALSLILFIVIFAVLKSGHKVNSIAFLFIFSFFLASFLYFLILGIYKNDVFYGFLGFREYIKNKRKLLGASCLIFIIACLFGILFSSNKALIKITFHEAPAAYVPLQEQTMSDPGLNMNYDFVSDLEKLFPDNNKFPTWIWDLIFGIIKWAAIIGLAVGLIVFFFKPFFTSHFKNFWKEGKLIQFLRQLWKDVRSFFKSISFRKNKEAAYSTVESKRFRDGVRDFLKKSGRSKEKKAEIDRLTKHFMRLIDWGEAKKIHYQQNLAPAEYTCLIAGLSENLREAAKLSGQLFEKALYDKNVLNAEEEKLFISSLDEIINCSID